jgi:hypothetical protein
MRVYKGDYQQYLARRAREQEAERERAAREHEKARQGAARAAERRRRDGRGAQARGPTLEEVEDQIHELEARLHQLGTELAEASAAQEFDRVRDLGVEYHQIEAELEDRLAEWTILGEAGA